MKADWFFCFARFIIAKGQAKWSFSQVHYQQTNCWNNYANVFKIRLRNVAFLQN